MAVLLKPFPSSSWGKEAIADLYEVRDDFKVGPPEDELIKEMADVELLVADVDIGVTRRLLENSPKLKAVLCTSIGYDYVDLQAATDLGILVANSPDFCTVAVAEYAVGLVFAITRNISLASQKVKENNWGARTNLGGIELTGKTAGIVGFGKIGREVAKRLQGLQMKILAFDPFVKKEAAAELGVELVSLEELLGGSDVVSLHTSLGAGTAKLIGEREFGLMKDGAYFINVARGGVIDEEALIKALESGKIRGAALDVLTKEPPEKDNPLLKMDNVVITPHIGWFSADAGVKSNKTLIEQIKAVKAGRAPAHVLNPQIIPDWEKKVK